MKIKFVVRIVTGIIVGIFSLYSVYFFFTNPAYPRYEDCGRIESKSTDEVAIKHGVQTELYLNVQFKKTGFKAMNVDPTTYFHYKEGDYICFDLRKETSAWYGITFLTGATILAVAGLVLIGWFVYYLFN